MTIKLHCFGESGNSYKAALALEMSGLQWEPVFVDFFNGETRTPEFRKDANFGFEVPVDVPGVAEVLLDPRRTWDDGEAYDRQAAKLVEMFSKNFEQYLPYIDNDVKAAAIG